MYKLLTTPRAAANTFDLSVISVNYHNVPWQSIHDKVYKKWTIVTLMDHKKPYAFAKNMITGHFRVKYCKQHGSLFPKREKGNE